LGRRPGKRLTDHQFGFSVTVARSDVEKVNAGVGGLMRRDNRFLARGRAPNLPGAAATESKATNLTQPFEKSFFHRIALRFARWEHLLAF